MSDCWSILGIDATTDKRSIKLAYAKQLKTTRPDQDPAGFSRLHDAYKEAQWLADSDWYWQNDEESPASSVLIDDLKPPQNSEQTIINDILAKPVDVSHPHENPVSASKPLEIADDASAFFDNVLLPNEWLNQLAQTSTITEHDLNLGLQFDAETRNKATHLILERVYWFYQRYQSNTSELNPFQWAAFEGGGFGQEHYIVRSHFLQVCAQKLQWWTSSNAWQAEFDANFVHELFKITASKSEQQKYWRGTFFKFKAYPEKHHQGIMHVAPIWRRVLAKLIDFMFFAALLWMLRPIAIWFFDNPITAEKQVSMLIFLLGFISLLVFIVYETGKQRGFIGSKIMGIKLVYRNGYYLESADTLKHFWGWLWIGIFSIMLPVSWIVSGITKGEYLLAVFGAGIMVASYFFSIKKRLDPKKTATLTILR